MEFIDRERELAFLQTKWQEPEAQLIVLWGKRRVGKTELVTQFIKDKPHIYFLAESTSDQDQLKRFSVAVGKHFGERLLETRGFADWQESFEYIQAKNRRIAIVVDEFPYLITSNPAIGSIFQKGWDQHLSKGKSYLVLLGSSMAMMKNEVLGYRAPLYGRRTGQWRVDPMTFAAVRGFRSGRTFEDCLCHYAVAGGIPAYWLQFDPKKDFASNLRERLLKKGQFLYDEVELVLREELREPRYYFALLQAISQGKRKLGEIVNATGLSQPVANKYLGVLGDLKIVEKELPVTEDKQLKSKKGLYRITDEFFQFWFRYVFPRRGGLEMGRVEEVVKDILDDLPQYLSLSYEKVAKEVLLMNSQQFFPFSAIGRWWDRNEEIDLMALNPQLDSILFAEVKWSKNQVGTDVYEALKRKAQQVQWGTKARKEYYCLFSRSGFTRALEQKAKDEGVRLFKKDELIN